MSLESVPLRAWFRESLAVEWTCAREFTRLTLRSPRYLSVIVPMYLRSAVLPVRATAVRRAYVLARVLDDAIDGDRVWLGDPEKFVRRLIEDACPRRITGIDPVSRLARCVFEQADRLGRGREAPSRSLVTLLETMLFDAKRARHRLILPEADLSAHLLRAYGSALDTALSLAGSTLRAGDLRDVVEAQAALYSLRDLSIDLSRGVVNIPEEVVAAARGEGALDLSAEVLLLTRAVRVWRAERLEAGIRHVTRSRARVAAAKDRRARWVVSPIMTGLGLLVRRLGRASSLGQAPQGALTAEGA